MFSHTDTPPTATHMNCPVKIESSFFPAAAHNSQNVQTAAAAVSQLRLQASAALHTRTDREKERCRERRRESMCGGRRKEGRKESKTSCLCAVLQEVAADQIRDETPRGKLESPFGSHCAWPCSSAVAIAKCQCQRRGARHSTDAACSHGFFPMWCTVVRTTTFGCHAKLIFVLFRA